MRKLLYALLVVALLLLLAFQDSDAPWALTR